MFAIMIRQRILPNDKMAEQRQREAMVIEMLSNGMESSRITQDSGRSTVDISGQTSVVTLGRTLQCNTFDEELADKFVKVVLVPGKDRLKEIFDRYRETSIKYASRK